MKGALKYSRMLKNSFSGRRGRLPPEPGWSVKQGACGASSYLFGLAGGLPNLAPRVCRSAGTPQPYSWCDYAALRNRPARLRSALHACTRSAPVEEFFSILIGFLAQLLEPYRTRSGRPAFFQRQRHLYLAAKVFRPHREAGCGENSKHPSVFSQDDGFEAGHPFGPADDR